MYALSLSYYNIEREREKNRSRKERIENTTRIEKKPTKSTNRKISLSHTSDYQSVCSTRAN
jgi:hypothetical protein